jgi:hypothetical protein
MVHRNKFAVARVTAFSVAPRTLISPGHVGAGRLPGDGLPYLERGFCDRDGLARRSGPIWYTDELSTIMARERNLRHMSSQATVGPARRRSGGLDRDRYRRDMVTDAYH